MKNREKLNTGQEGERKSCFKSAHKALSITYSEEFTMPNVLALTFLQALLKA